jgi:sulfur-carrier protein
VRETSFIQGGDSRGHPHFMLGTAEQQYLDAKTGAESAASNGYTHWYFDGILTPDRPDQWTDIRISLLNQKCTTLDVAPLYQGIFEVAIGSDVELLRRAPVDWHHAPLARFGQRHGNRRAAAQPADVAAEGAGCDPRKGVTRMVHVNLWSGLRCFPDGKVVQTVLARNLPEMPDALTAAHPALAPTLKAGVSVLVNGVIETDMFAPLPDHAEIFLIQRIKGD